jgi:hypothetical protein
MIKITKDQAFRASVAKWEALAEDQSMLLINDIVVDDFTLRQLRHRCGFCHYYMPAVSDSEKSIVPSIGNCGKCPLVIDGKTCVHDDHPYTIWAESELIEDAQAVLDLIRSVKDKHFEDEKEINT